MLRALISRIPSRSSRASPRLWPRALARSGPAHRRGRRVWYHLESSQSRRQVSKAVSESADDYADRSISRSTESTDILIIFYRLVTTRLWQPSNGTGRGPSGREDNRRGKGRRASGREHRIRDIHRQPGLRRWRERERVTERGERSRDSFGIVHDGNYSRNYET